VLEMRLQYPSKSKLQPRNELHGDREGTVSSSKKTHYDNPCTFTHKYWSCDRNKCFAYSMLVRVYFTSLTFWFLSFHQLIRIPSLYYTRYSYTCLCKGWKFFTFQANECRRL